MTRLAGKWKLGQNRPPADQDGILRGLAAEDAPAATELAAVMRRARGEARG